jgi:hypothetical protein
VHLRTLHRVLEDLEGGEDRPLRLLLFVARDQAVIVVPPDLVVRVRDGAAGGGRSGGFRGRRLRGGAYEGAL